MSYKRLLPFIGLAIPLQAHGQSVPFHITFENLGPQPFSEIFVATTNSQFDLFTEGSSAPGRIEMLAEDGDTSQAKWDAINAHAVGNVRQWRIVGQGAIPVGNSYRATLVADTEHRYLQWAAMLTFSNDAFIGSAYGDQAIDLFENGIPINRTYYVGAGDVYDAGTEINTEAGPDLAAFFNFGLGPDEHWVVTRPHAGLQGIGDIPSQFNWSGSTLARVTIAAVPEPTTFLGYAGALIGLLAVRRRRR